MLVPDVNPKSIFQVIKFLARQKEARGEEKPDPSNGQ
jgi:hypothetical protein